MKPFTALDTCNECKDDFIYYNGNSDKRCPDCKKREDILTLNGYIVEDLELDGNKIKVSFTVKLRDQ